MAFSVSTRSALDGAGATIPGGVVFIDESGAGTGPWIIAKTTIDPSGVNVQFVLANNAAKCDISSINGTVTPTGHGTAAGALRVELPTDGTGLVNAAQSGPWTVQQGGAPWSITQADHTATGTVTAVNQAVTVSTVGDGNVTAFVSANTNVTLTFEGTVDGANWFTVNAYPIPGGSAVTGINTNGQWAIPVGGFNQFRMRVTAVGATPTATVALNAGAGSTQPSVVVSPTAGNFLAFVSQSGAVWVDNVSQFGGTNISTGTGASGAGIPRVTVSNDSNVLATQSGTWTVQQGGAPWTVNPGTAANWAVGATGSAVPANADYDGGLAKTALPTAATDGNLTGLMLDKFGRQVALVSTIRDLVGTQTTTISASTTETTIVTAAASVFNDLIMLIVTNTSTATTTRIDFRDTTGGAVLFSLISIGGQQPVGFALPTPIPQTSVNTNWTAQCATSTTDIRIYAVFAKNR
jgi:hypothetical protein